MLVLTKTNATLLQAFTFTKMLNPFSEKMLKYAIAMHTMYYYKTCLKYDNKKLKLTPIRVATQYVFANCIVYMCRSCYLKVLHFAYLYLARIVNRPNKGLKFIY